MSKTQTTSLRGRAVLRNPLLNKGSAFTEDERDLLGLAGLLPPGWNSQEQQASRFYAKYLETNEPLEKYRTLRSLLDRNEHLFYRLLQDHLTELMPVVYTPTVGLATQSLGAVFEHGRGVWITPAHRGRIRDVLERACEGRDIQLSVVTDNESILGIGDQGAGGIAISIGKLALYTGAAGIDPSRTLPVSLDVGTNNQALLDDPLYLGWREPRLTGDAYDSLVEEFVEAFAGLFPDALLQWEDFRKDNALRIMERYRERVLSFNDDIQGTGAVALAGLFGALRVSGEPLEEQRVVILGAGAAGLGIARQIKAALRMAGVDPDDAYRNLAVLDSHGLVVDDREFRDQYKRELAWPAAFAVGLGLQGGATLDEVVPRYRPTVLIGASGQHGAFSESIVRQMGDAAARPVIMPMSNPTANCEAVPGDVLRWTEGRALVATGSPFAPVTVDGKTFEIGQGNNVFVFPGLGLGALVARASRVSNDMITRAAQVLAEQVHENDLERGLLYPDMGRLREVTAVCAAAVAEVAFDSGLAGAERPGDLLAAVRAAMWTPEYPQFV